MRVITWDYKTGKNKQPNVKSRKTIDSLNKSEVTCLIEWTESMF
jgi:hypothetical protein